MGSITSLSHHYHHQVHHQQAQQLHASSAEYRMVSKEAEHKQATKHNPNALCCWIDGFQDQQNQNQKEKEDKKENNALEGKAKSHPMEGTPCVNLHDHYVCRASSDVMLYLCDHHFQKHKSFLEHKVLGKDNIDAYSLRPFSRGINYQQEDIVENQRGDVASFSEREGEISVSDKCSSQPDQEEGLVN